MALQPQINQARLNKQRAYALWFTGLSGAGKSTLSALINEQLRARFTPGEFIVIFADAKLRVRKAGDIKGLYRKARAGEITDFTGIDSAFEPPCMPEIHLKTAEQSAQACAQTVIDYLRSRNYLPVNALGTAIEL